MIIVIFQWWFSTSFISSIFDLSSSIKKSSLCLANHLYLYGLMIFILLFGLLSNIVTINFVAEIVSDLTIVIFISLAPESFLTWRRPCSQRLLYLLVPQMHLYFTSPCSGVKSFTKELWFLLLKNGILKTRSGHSGVVRGARESQLLSYLSGQS